MKRVSTITACILMAICALSAWAQTTPAEKRAVIIVDSSVYPEIRTRLHKYIDHIRWEFNIELKVTADNFYSMSPPEIRGILKNEYETSPVPLVGAIMVGPIPHAIRGEKGAVQKTREAERLAREAEARGEYREARRYIGTRPYMTPAALYYEDFDAEWFDEDGDGVFERVENTPQDNASEIWTAWWIPPTNNPAAHGRLLNDYLRKLDLYHSGRLPGKNGMIFLADNVNSVEITESWTVLMNEAMKSTDQKVIKVISRHAQMAEKVLPEHADEFFEEELVKPLSSLRLQHFHIGVHGNPSGFYWNGRAVTVDNLNLRKFRNTGAHIFTTAGCSNGNFRGLNQGDPDYTKSIGNQLLFSRNTITVAYYGAASPQSTSIFAMYHTEMIEALDPEKNSYLAEGYFKMRNSDYSWGTNHYFFRGYDEKILSGDPFARYR